MNTLASDSRPARLLLGALVLGLAADWLLKAGPGRAGLFVWVIIAVLTAIACLPAANGRRDVLLLLGATVLVASAFLFRASEPLYALTFLATLVFAALVAWHGRGRSLIALRISDLFIAPIRAGYAAVTGAPVLLMNDMGPVRAGSTARRRYLLAGALLAIPPVFIVGALLVASDPVFERVAVTWTSLLSEEVIEHLITIVVFAWLTAGWLRSISKPVGFPLRLPDASEIRPRTDFLIVAPALVAVSTLLLLYLGVQARALFGGPEYVQLTSGLTYAEYARQGFFGLAVVAGIVLTLLLVADWAIDRSDARAVRSLRLLGWVLLGLVAVLVASAGYRMSLYMRFFGLSDARIYATAFMVLAALALAWSGLTVMRGRRDRFGIGMLALAAAWLVSLYVVNPESLAARVNIDRAVNGQALDVAYHASLSVDALPTLLAGAPRLQTAECTALITAMHPVWGKRLNERHADDWRTWSVPTFRASGLMDGSAPELIARHCR